MTEQYAEAITSDYYVYVIKADIKMVFDSKIRIIIRLCLKRYEVNINNCPYSNVLETLWYFSHKMDNSTLLIVCVSCENFQEDWNCKKVNLRL